MKKIVSLLISFILLSSLTSAQVGINSDNSIPHPSAVLDVKSIEKGFLPPRMTAAQISGILNPANGLEVFCTDNNLIYIYNGAGQQWKPLAFGPGVITPQCDGKTFTIHHITGAVAPVSKLVTYGLTTMPGTDAKCWITQNLGASRQALSVNDATEASAGWYWLFGEKEGYQHDGLVCYPHIYGGGHEQWIISRDPCRIELGGGWRIPTATEWTNVDATSSWVNWNDPWNSPLKMHAAGFVMGSDQGLYERGYSGNYWSSSSLPGFPYYQGYQLYFTHSICVMALTEINPLGYRYANSLRCVTNCMNSPEMVMPTTHTSSNSGIIWNWYPAAYATGYKWGTTNDYSAATDIGLVTTKTELNLNCNTFYDRYLWAYNDCGATPTTLTMRTLPCPPVPCYIPSITVNHQAAGMVAPVDKTLAYGTITGVAGNPEKCWITRNLGASQQAGTVSDPSPAAAGWYWQFNRKQGFAHDGVSRTPNATWITGINELSNWVSGNDPCTHELGSHWRIPTMTEWDNAYHSDGWNTWNGPWQSSLKLHAAGFLDNTSGTLVYRGIEGDIWSSTQQGSGAGSGLKFNFDVSSIMSADKSYGLPLRCISDCADPSYPAPGVHSSTKTTITWNWTSVSGAVGYKWGTANNLATATEIGTANTRTETGLNCNTNYIRYVWAYNECGTSNVATMNYYTLNCESCNIPDLTINHTTADGVAPVDKTVTYGTVTNIPGEPSKCWITRNLGAGRQALSVSDYSETSAGWYWQFNRKQGYKHDEVNATPAWPVTGISENSNWSIGNDPCRLELGAGWRLPTNSEWLNVDNSGGWSNWIGSWNSGLKLHAAGSVFYGDLGNRGSQSYFWSSTQDQVTTGYHLQSNASWCFPATSEKVAGCSVRCLSACTTVPAAPASGTHNATINSIIWNWNTVSGATGYKWGTTDNFAGATDMGSATTKTETGLVSGTPYIRYIWSYNDCGPSDFTQLTQSTLTWVCGTGTIVINHLASGGVAPVNKSVTYGTVTNIPGETAKCWITRNLGASQQATEVNDATEASAGWYWQFNRKQGYKHDGSVVTPSWTITTIDENSDWQAVNDPCTFELGTGWRIPTNSEWGNVNNASGWANWTGPWSSGLKMHGAGYLNSSNAALADRGSHGYNWSSTQNLTYNGWVFDFSSGFCGQWYYQKAHALPLRCIRN